MKPLLCLFCAFLVSASFLRADEPATAALWKKAQETMSALEKRQDPPPETPDAMMAYFKKVITEADAANKAFLDKFPHDPRRWRIRVFDAKTAGMRRQLRMESHGSMKTILEEVRAAPDADAEAKGQASAVEVLVAAEGLAAGADVNAWAALAEEHLKKYPDLEMNEPIQTRLDGIKVAVELKTKPLDLKFKALDGREVDLAKMRGKVVLVDFWATWCAQCVVFAPKVVKLYEKLHARGFEIVGISLDSDKERMEHFLKEMQIPWPQYFDGKTWQNSISSKLGIRVLPAMWLVNKKGMVVSMDAREGLEDLVEQSLGE